MIKATLLLLLTWYLVPRMTRRSAAERHLLWAASLGAACLLPPLDQLLPAWQPEWARRVMLMLPSSLDGSSASALGQAADIVVRANGVESTPWTLGAIWPMLWTITWMSGTCTTLLMLAVEAVKLARLARSAHQETNGRWHRVTADVAHVLGLRRYVRVLTSARSIVPVTWGFWHPRVLLPARAGEWRDDRARAVLMHELAHVRRGDWAVHLAAELICAVYWFNPLFWIAKRWLCRESEHAADDEVLGLGVEGDDYATHLLEIVRAAQAPVRAWSPTVAMGRAPHLERRFAALLNAYANRRAITWWKALAAAGVALLVVIPLGAIMSARGVAPNIEIRTANLPAITQTATLPGSEPAAPAVRNVRAIGVGDSSEPLTRPEVFEYTTPALYSDEARVRRIEGLVTLRARVESDGRVSTVYGVVKGLGFGLDQNALVALRQWRFQPGTRAGRPVAMDVEVDIEFSLRNEAVNELIANDMATRVGPGVTPPRAVRMFALWPRRSKIQGTVVLDVVLLENGTPKIVKILQSLDPALDESAIRNFAQWRFSPAMKDGRPVKIRMNAEVHFHG